MKSFCIIGLNKFGESMAMTMASEGRDVLVIDEDADRVNAIADFVTNGVIGDATNESVLRRAGVREYDCAIVCLGKVLNDSIMLVIALKELGVKFVVARAVSDSHKKVLERIGADLVVFPEQESGERLGVTLAHDNVTDFMEFKGFQMAEVMIPKSWEGKTLIELGIRNKYGITVVAVHDVDGNVTVSPAPTRVFKEGELVNVIGDDAAMTKFIHAK